jgi:gliding motility-associated-like protein/uncharacterized repeat protein (TIGR01451 family)
MHIAGHPFRLMVVVFCLLFMDTTRPLFAQVDPNRNGNGNLDLQLTKRADKLSARAGSRVVFTLQLKNRGAFAAEEVTVADPLPSGFTFVGSSSPLAYNSVTGDWEVENLQAGDSVTLHLTAVVNPITPAANYTNLAYIADSKNNDPQLLNDTARSTIAVYDFAAAPATICANTSAVLQATAVNITNPVFRWFADPSLTQLLFTGPSFVTPLLDQTTSYYVSVTGSNIVPSIPAETAVVTVSVLNAPPAPQVTIVQPDCFTATGTININASFVAGNYYSVDGATFTNASGVFNNLLTGTYRVFIKSPNGCISPATTAVIAPQPLVPPAPSLSLVQPSCAKGSGTITITSPRNTGNSFSLDGSNYTNTTGIFENLAPGNYPVSVKGIGGCISAVTVALVLPDPQVPPAPTVLVTQPVCPAPTGAITITSPTGTGYTYSLDGSTFFNNTGIFAGLQPGAYAVSVKNPAGCISPATIATVNVPVLNEPKLTITVNGAAQICSGGSVVLTASAADGYQWYKYGIPMAGAQGQSFTATSEGVFTVSRRSAAGCLSPQSDGVLVTVAPQPVQPLLYAEKRTFCAGDSAILVAGVAGAMQWYRDGQPIAGVSGFTLAVKVTGVYTVKSVDPTGCAGLASNPVFMQVLPKPVKPVLDITQPNCFNKGIISILSPLAPGNLYSLDGSGYTNTTGVFSALSAGTYRVGVKATNGCTSELTEAIILGIPLNDSLLTISSSRNTQLCVGDSVLLTASAAGSYQWYQSGIPLAGANAASLLVKAEGMYTVSKKRSGNCSYPQSDAIRVAIVLPPTPPVIAANKQILCAGETVTVQSSQAFALQWYRNGQPLPGATTVQLPVQSSGTYTAIASNSNGCNSAFSNPVVFTVIDIPATPVLEINGTTQFCKDESRLLKVKTIPPAHTVQWFRNNVPVPAVFGDTLRVNDGATYRVTLTNSNGCVSLSSNVITTAVVCVTGIYVPDVFTPNGDGVNDVIHPVTPGIRKFKWFKIYNRWGNLVFESANPQVGWDGRFRGKDQPADTYIWVVEGADGNGVYMKKTGMLNLLRQ